MQKNAKKMQLTKEKGGPRQKKAVQKGSKIFSGAFGAGYSLPFQRIKCKNFQQEKATKSKFRNKMLKNAKMQKGFKKF